MVKCAPQLILIVTFLWLYWLAMQAIHEGHGIGVLLTGADIQKVHLHPLTLSGTELLTNPHPAIVV